MHIWCLPIPKNLVPVQKPIILSCQHTLLCKLVQTYLSKPILLVTHKPLFGYICYTLPLRAYIACLVFLCEKETIHIWM